MAVKPKIIDRDLGWGRLTREIQKARRKPHVAVGVFGAEATKDHGGLPNIEVATSHEFGVEISHPGGTAYIIGEDGKAQFISNAAAAGKDLPRTKPHKIKVPERSFIRATLDQKARRITSLAKGLVGRVLDGTTDTKKALQTLGVFIQGEIRGRMSKGIPPPLKASTIRRKTVQGKSGTTPLIDTGQLRGSIDFEVKNV